MTKTCKELKERMPRNKYRDIDRARLAYAKQRKHTKAATDKLLRRLLNLLSKQIGQCLGIHMANSAILAARQLGHRRKGEETSKTTSIKKWCRFSTSELRRRRTLIPFQPKNTLFHAQRTENFSANSKPYRYTTFTGLSPVENSSH